jgi:hypothetical protein
MRAGSSGWRPAQTLVSLPSTASLPSIERAVPHLEARAPERAHLGCELDNVVEARGLEKTVARVHQRNGDSKNHSITSSTSDNTLSENLTPSVSLPKTLSI